MCSTPLPGIVRGSIRLASDGFNSTTDTNRDCRATGTEDVPNRVEVCVPLLATPERLQQVLGVY